MAMHLNSDISKVISREKSWSILGTMVYALSVAAAAGY